MEIAFPSPQPCSYVCEHLPSITGRHGIGRAARQAICRMSVQKVRMSRTTNTLYLPYSDWWQNAHNWESCCLGRKATYCFVVPLQLAEVLNESKARYWQRSTCLCCWSRLFARCFLPTRDSTPATARVGANEEAVWKQSRSCP